MRVCAHARVCVLLCVCVRACARDYARARAAVCVLCIGPVCLPWVPQLALCLDHEMVLHEIQSYHTQFDFIQVGV